MNAIGPSLAQVRKRLKKLDLGREQVYGLPELEYFYYYGLDIPDVRHWFGLLRSDGRDLATHVFVPKRYRAAVVLVHGYLEHGAYFRHAARALLAAGYAVVIFDLPGHGFSSGSFAVIRDFSAYAKATAAVMRFAGRALKKPVHLVGHSMGCSAIIELLLAGKPPGTGKVVLAAPLVHPAHWALTNSVYKLISPVVLKVPRMFPIHSSDREFMLFTLFKDPLLRKNIPISWVRCMLRWNKNIEKYAPSDKKLLVIQGTADAIVDAEFNVAFLRKKFPLARTYRVERANHQLFNEAKPYRTRTLNAIVRFFK